MNVAVIPARGGSKRIPRKNMKSFYGQPAIAWSIQAALESNCFERVIVSTDDAEIAEISRKYGAETPFVRPADLANDTAGTTPVIRHAIEWLRANGNHPTAVCCIFPAIFFIEAEDIKKGLSLLTSSNCNYVLPVASYQSPIQRAFRITENNRIQMFQPENFNKRSQEMETAYHDASQFYWGKADAWVQGIPFYGEGSIPIPIPRHRVVDIDTQEDWEGAELLFELLKKRP